MRPTFPLPPPSSPQGAHLVRSMFVVSRLAVISDMISRSRLRLEIVRRRRNPGASGHTRRYKGKTLPGARSVLPWCRHARSSGTGRYRHDVAPHPIRRRRIRCSGNIRLLPAVFRRRRGCRRYRDGPRDAFGTAAASARRIVSTTVGIVKPEPPIGAVGAPQGIYLSDKSP